MPSPARDPSSSRLAPMRLGGGSVRLEKNRVVSGDRMVHRRASTSPMTSPSILVRLTPRSLIAAASLLSFAGAASAFTPALSKLSGRPYAAADFDGIGWAVGSSEKWLVSTSPGDESVGGVAGAGAVYVYSATTGRFTRKIRPTDLTTGNRFGQTVSVCGDLALIGAPGQGDGVVYLCNLATGAVVRKFSSPTPNGEFGSSVALSAEWAVIGAYLDDNGDGAVYVYRHATTAPPLRIAAPAPAAGSNFGFRVAVQNDLVIAGAFASDLAAADAGAVFVFSSAGQLLTSITDPTPSATHLFGTSLAVNGTEVLVGASHHGGQVGRVNRFDLRTGASKGTLVATDGQAGDLLGAVVAASGNLAVVGAPGHDDTGTDAGSAYVFDLSTGRQLRKVSLPSGSTSASFGGAVSIWGNQALVGASNDDDIAEKSGAAYLCRPVIGTAPLVSVARAGDAAASTQEAEFAAFSTAFLNDDDESLIQASLGGPGGAGITGVWSSMRNKTTLDVLVRSRLRLDSLPDPSFDGLTATPFGAPVMCNNTHGLMQATLSGPGVTPLNNRVLFVNAPLSNQVVSVVRTGDIISLSGAVLHSVVDMVQAQSTDALLVSLTKRLNVGGVTATNDSALNVMAHFGTTSARFEEGANAAAGGVYGQFFGRAAVGMDTSGAFGTHVISGFGGSPAPALFRGEFNGSAARLVIRGQQAADCPTDVVYSAFVAEAHQNFRTVFKATLTGPGVTTANNTGLWHDTAGLIARTGSEIESGLTVTAIDRFWPISDDQVLFQVTLRGTGVTAANNRALYLWDEGDPVLRILRTGSFADPDCGQATIAGILQVGVHPVSGRYAILASLKGSSPATNLGLWVGGTLEGNATTLAAKRRPSLVLRKGTTLLAPSGQTTTLLSLAMSNTTNATGAGNIGKGQVVNEDGNVALILEFTNRAREVMTWVR